MPARQSHDYERQGVTSLFAALNVATGETIGTCHRRYRHQEFLKFLIRIDAAVLADVDVHLVMDNRHGSIAGCSGVVLQPASGTWAAWLYDVLKPHVGEILICNPRRNALLKEGSKNDRVDARKLSELLYAGMLRAVYHGENGLRTLRELARSYQVVSKDLKRVMNRIKALYRSWVFPARAHRLIAGGIASSG